MMNNYLIIDGHRIYPTKLDLRIIHVDNIDSVFKTWTIVEYDNYVVVKGEKAVLESKRLFFMENDFFVKWVNVEIKVYNPIIEKVIRNE